MTADGGPLRLAGFLGVLGLSLLLPLPGHGPSAPALPITAGPDLTASSWDAGADGIPLAWTWTTPPGSTTRAFLVKRSVGTDPPRVLKVLPPTATSFVDAAVYPWIA